MQPQKQYVHRSKWHKGSQTNWTGSHTETRVVLGTQDLHPDTYRGGRIQLNMGPEIYCRHQGTQAGKTRNEHVLHTGFKSKFK